MDLSKIPEPSEGDLSDAAFFLAHHPYSAEDRVIAHLLRHGRVLAKQSDPKNNHRTFTMEQIAEMERQRLEAVKFFEQFGGTP